MDLAVDGRASWHDEYRDSAYVFVGNLDKRLTEGDVIAVFSQYGEVMDINLPRVSHNDQQDRRQSSAGESQSKAGDRRGFGFLLYEDQRSTVLAVDNLNGFALLGRTLRVDHVRDYKMPRRRDEEGQLVEAKTPSRNAAPKAFDRDAEKDDLDDPMASYIARSKHNSEKEEHRRRKEDRRRRREEREDRRQRHDARKTTEKSPSHR